MRLDRQDAQEARERLQAYLDQIAEVIAMLPPSGAYFVRGAGERVRQAAQQLKAAVKADYKRSQRPATEVERNFVAPCMHRLFVALQAFRTNTSPGPDWHRALYNAEFEVNHWLHQLGQPPEVNEGRRSPGRR
jgi:hypothetical protein